MSGDISDYQNLTVGCALPLSRWLPTGGEDVLARMTGATIVRIGAPHEDGLEGGGLVVDYQPISGAPRRVVFAFNENGMWVVSEGPMGPF